MVKPMRIVNAALVTVLVVAGACSGSTGRPTAAEWTPGWESARALLPSADAIEADGTELCGDFLGEVRSRREELLPAPDEPVDEAFLAWIEQAEALGLDCEDDSENLDDRVEEIEQLGERVDLALTGS